MRQAVIEAAAPNPSGKNKDCYGAPEDALRELVRSGHPEATLVRVLAHRPRELGVPKLVAWLVDQAELGFLALPSTAQLEDLLRSHEQRAATFAANGLEDRAQHHEDEAARLRHELTLACETEPRGSEEAVTAWG